MDRTAKVQLRSFKIVDRLGPRIEVVKAHPSVPFAIDEEDYRFCATFRNVGDTKGRLDIFYHQNWRVSAIPVSVSAVIEPGEEYKLKSEWKGNSANFEWKCFSDQADQPVQSGHFSEDVGVLRQKSFSLHTMDAQDWRALFFIPNDELLLDSLTPLKLQCNDGQNYQDIAWLKQLFEVEYISPDGFSRYGSQLTQETKYGLEKDQVIFQRNLSSFAQVHIEISHIEQPRSALRFIYSFSNNGNDAISLLRFTGPMLYVGEKSFGSKKDRALFPGVEFLDAEAVSSSDAVARPPVRDQYIPHPWKATAPLMAVVHEGKMISLLWPADQEWAPGQRGMSPVFASPNRYYGQNNSLMGLFVPPVPEYGLENQETASKPYIVKPGEEVKFECILYMTQSDDPIDAVLAWLDFYNEGKLPKPVPPPRDYLDEIALSRQAYLTTCWDEKAKGWGHCAGWKAYPSGGMLALLALDEMLTSNPETKEQLRERIDVVYRELVDKHGAASLGVAAGCHVMMFESAFFWGVTEQSLPSWLKVAEGLMAAQNPDGSWGYRIGKEEQRELGREGEVVSGTIAPDAMYMMQLGRISGNAKITQAGLKALEALNQHRVPRGSQGWECPIAAPDVLVSGYGTRANLDAYLITGERRYLDNAVYWARTGLAFHYLWNLPDRPLQRYATIPIFGTTFFTHSWLGVPVQWCGLVYAYHLLELAEHDDTLPWRTLAEGIVNSAMHQQMTEGPYVGTLPDSYGDYFITARGAYINPENILSNLHVLNGNSLDIRTAFVNGPGVDALRVSANADICITQRGDNQFIYELSSLMDRVSETIIAPLTQPPVTVAVDGNALSQLDSLFEITEGWHYSHELKALFIHAKHGEKAVEIKVRAR